MYVELGLAAALGCALLWLVLAPLVSRAVPRIGAAEPVEPEETERGIALAALREIEFDRETGKLSDVDYSWLKARYTRTALDALRESTALEAGGSVDTGVDLEAMIAARVRTLAGGETAACPTCGPRGEPDAAFCSNCGRGLNALQSPNRIVTV